MKLTKDRGIVDAIIEHAGWPFDEQEPRVVLVAKYEGFLGDSRPLYAVVFEGEPEPVAAETVWP